MDSFVTLHRDLIDWFLQVYLEIPNGEILADAIHSKVREQT